MSLVSICIPTYNHGPFLAEAIESLLAQDFRDFKLFVVDDASTDDTGEVVKPFALRDARLHYRRNARNLGCFGNASACTRQATGRRSWPVVASARRRAASDRSAEATRFAGSSRAGSGGWVKVQVRPNGSVRTARRV